MRTFLLGAALAAAIAAPGAAAALPAPSIPSFDAGQAQPIGGWVDFCRRHPADCAVDVSEPAEIRLTPEIWGTIHDVNRRVNAAILPRTDWEIYGQADVWTYPASGVGDCEDYQLLKRHMLVQAGLPRRAMRMTVVIDEKGEGHAVLMVRTDRGDFILDNKTNAVLPWHETGYVYVKREGQASTAWTSLGHVSSPVATANRR